MENWKDVAGYPGYKVSDLGRVQGPRVILTPSLHRDGYHHVKLCGDTQKTFYVHRLVAAAFIGPCPAGHEVDHRNRIRNDNRAVNLQYLTHSENGLNRAKHAGCSSIYIGVCKDGTRWMARASAEKQVYLGTFDSEGEAARARDKYYRDRGQFVTFNFE